MKALFVTLAYTFSMIWLFIKFPIAMLIFNVISIGVLLYLAKKAPFDYELWPDLYQKPPLP